MFCSRDRKAALTPDADMEDDQNGCAALIEELQETFCFHYCVHVCNFNRDHLTAGQMEMTSTLKLNASGML